MGSRNLFREIKQQLQIKSFVSTTKNSVLIQMWTTVKNHTYPEGAQNTGKRCVVPIQFSLLIRLNLIVKVEWQKWLDNPFANELPSSNNKIHEVHF